MIQLFAYDTTGLRWELDLYSEEPVKINLSAEDIIDIPRIDAEFTRQFRIPATGPNSQFFKYWYIAGAIDFDVTQKVQAELHVDGLLYRQGQLRLQGVYNNPRQDRIDLEVVFLGPTKDFSSEIGEGPMTQLDLTDSSHVLTLTNIQNSWLPLTNPSVFLGGKIRYILADRGYPYIDGVIQSVPGASAPSEIADKDFHAESFQKNSHPLFYTQFTPIVQIKYLIDAIFARTSYTYSSDSIFNQSWFKDLYTDGLSSELPYIEGVPATFQAIPTATYPLLSSTEQLVQFGNEITDPSGSYNQSTYIYTAPLNGYYEFDGIVNVTDTTDQFGAAGTYGVRVRKNGVEVFANAQTPATPGTPFYPFVLPIGFAYYDTLVAGDQVWVTIETFNEVAPNITQTATEFRADIAPTTISTADLMKPDLKMIDFFKSVLTKFRCVMVPSKTVENQFIIKPWKDYIATGDAFDWTDKLDGKKDIKLEPVFYKQSALINFTDIADEDRINQYHQDTFKYVYGRLLFDSQSELLDSTRDVTTIFAPTPVDQLEGAPATSNFIIPILSQNGDDIHHGHPTRLPLVAKPRLLYWNGLQPIASDESWYYTDGLTTVHNTTNYPRASYLSAIPTTSTTLNLNWSREFAYFGDGGIPGTGGESVYERYWQTYIASLYSPEARLMTAYFVLDNEDLRNLTFDDVIFVKDSYWRLNKVTDAPLGEVESVKVELIKLINFDPQGLDWTPTPGGGTSGGELDPDINLPTE